MQSSGDHDRPKESRSRGTQAHGRFSGVVRGCVAVLGTANRKRGDFGASLQSWWTSGLGLRKGNRAMTLKPAAPMIWLCAGLRQLRLFARFGAAGIAPPSDGERLQRGRRRAARAQMGQHASRPSRDHHEERLSQGRPSAFATVPHGSTTGSTLRFERAATASGPGIVRASHAPPPAHFSRGSLASRSHCPRRRAPRRVVRQSPSRYRSRIQEAWRLPIGIAVVAVALPGERP